MRGIIFAGTAVTREGAIGGLYRLDHGGEWHQPTGIPLDAGVQAITTHYADHTLMFTATRKGVFKSTDSGATWHKLSIPADPPVQFWTVVVHPTKPETLFASGGPISFYRSDDLGHSWRKGICHHPETFKITFGASRVMRIAFHPTNPDIMYAVAEINGLLCSLDGGEHWAPANQAIAQFSERPAFASREVTEDDREGMYDAHSICTTPALPNTAFYACRLGIFTTDDFGRHLRDLEVKRFTPFNYTRDVRVACDNPKTLYACFSISSRSSTGAMYRSMNLGASWSRIDEAMTVKSTIMGFNTHISDPNGLASVTRHGQVFYTLDGCKNWVERQLPENAGDAFCTAIL